MIPFGNGKGTKRPVKVSFRAVEMARWLAGRNAIGWGDNVPALLRGEIATSVWSNETLPAYNPPALRAALRHAFVVGDRVLRRINASPLVISLEQRATQMDRKLLEEK